MEIRIPQEEEKKKVVSFLSKVFHRPFPSLIPSLYGKDKNTMSYHFILEKEGKLRGAVCAYPEEIKVGGVSIKGLQIGMVATSKKTRGEGIMTKMLTHSFERYQDECEVSMLTGLRHRYEHFGYYPAGINYEFKVSEMSSKKWENGNPYTIVKAKTQDDFNKIEELKKERKLEVVRPLATETDTLKNWFSKAYLVYKNGELKGYAGGKLFGGQNLEILYVDGNVLDYIQAVVAYRKFKKAKSIMVEVLPTESTYLEAMSLCSEEYSIKSIYKYKVFSYKRLLEKLIAITLQDNERLSYQGVIAIEGKEKLKVKIENGTYSVEETNDDAEVTYSEKSAIAWLLGMESGVIPLSKISLRHSDFI